MSKPWCKASDYTAELQCVRKVAMHLQKVLEVMSTSVRTGLNPFNFIRKHFLQICVRKDAKWNRPDSIQNIPDWCHHLYSSCGSAKHRSQRAKPSIPGYTATFCGDCVKTCEDVAPNLGENNLVVSPWQRPLSYCRPHPVVSGEKLKFCHPPPTVLPWFGTLWLLIFKNEIEAERKPFWYHWGRIDESAWQKMTSRKRSKNEGDGGTGVYMREETTSRVMPADRPYGFMNFTVSVRNILDIPSYNLKYTL
jgi:hypothetical protein